MFTSPKLIITSFKCQGYCSVAWFELEPDRDSANVVARHRVRLIPSGSADLWAGSWSGRFAAGPESGQDCSPYGSPDLCEPEARDRACRSCAQRFLTKLVIKVYSSIKVSCVSLAREGPLGPALLAGPAQGIRHRPDCLELPTLALRVRESSGSVHDTGGEWRCLRLESAGR